jgi:hypothetical protein
MPYKPGALPNGVHSGYVVDSRKQPYLKQSECCSEPDQGFLAPIGNNAHTLDKKLSEYAENVQSSRREIFKLRRDIGEHIKRVRPCGAYVIDKTRLITVAKGKAKQSVFYSGLQTCKSVWACPVCSMKISHRRATEVNHMLTNAIVRDELHGQFVTLTIPHTVYDNLKTLQLVVSNGFRRLTNHPDYVGRSKKGVFTPGIKQRYGVKGFVRALEVKKKNKGWHPHLHIVFILDKMEAERLSDFSAEIIQLWAKIIKAATGKKINQEAGQDSKPITGIEGISDYISKWDIGKELTQSHRKLAGDSMTPFELFQYYKRSGDAKYLKHFEHYVLSFNNVKQLTFSKDFKKLFMDGIEEQTDEQACTEVEIEEILIAMDKQMYKEIHAAKLEADFLNLVQFQKDDAIDFIFHYFPDVKYSTDSDYPIFKLE